MVHKSDVVLALCPPEDHFLIRPVVSNDLDQLLQVIWKGQSHAKKLKQIKDMIQYHEKLVGVGVVVLNERIPEEMIIGYGALRPWKEHAEICDLIIEPAYRSMGYGTAMIQYLVWYALNCRYPYIEIGADVNNPRARKLYEELGFEFVRTLKGLYGKEVVNINYLQLMLSNRYHRSTDG